MKICIGVIAKFGLCVKVYPNGAGHFGERTGCWWTLLGNCCCCASMPMDGRTMDNLGEVVGRSGGPCLPNANPDLRYIVRECGHLKLTNFGRFPPAAEMGFLVDVCKPKRTSDWGRGIDEKNRHKKPICLKATRKTSCIF
jgi:hypothetical protein